MVAELDFDARYRVEWMHGVAFWIRPLTVTYYDEEGFEEITETATDRVEAIMVGDNRVWEVEVEELTMISDDDFCSGCGQIGCGHG